MSEGPTDVLEKVKLLCKAQLRALVVVYELYAANDFIVVLLNELLGADIGHTVKSDVADTSQVLQEILPQAMDKSVDIFRLA